MTAYGGELADPRYGPEIRHVAERGRVRFVRLRRATRQMATFLLRAWSRIPFDRLFWIGFAVLLLLFVVLLFVQPTGAGRGGR